MRTTIAAAHPAPRFDTMACFHKTQRYLMCETLPLFAALDASDEHSVDFGLRQLQEMLGYCEQVLEYLHTFVRPLVDGLCPGSGAALAIRAEECKERIAHLRRCSAAVEEAGDDNRVALMDALQRELVTYVACGLTELARTEREINRVLWPAYDDAVLMQLEARIFAAAGADRLQWSMQWMIPALNASERERFLCLLQKIAPQLYPAVLAMSEDLLSKRDYERLMQRLDDQAASAA